MTMEEAREAARWEYIATAVPMVYGWQTNDDTGEREPGFCPRSAVGPAFVHTPVGWFGLPKNTEDTEK